MPLLLAADLTVPRSDVFVTALDARLGSFVPEGAYRLSVLESLTEPGRLLFLLWVNAGRPVQDLVRSIALADWFDAAGVEDVPPVFAGEAMRRLDLHDPEATSEGPVADESQVAVIGIVHLAEFERFWGHVVASSRHLAASGGVRFWAIRAVDDPAEVLIVQGFSGEEEATSWIAAPAGAADWMSGAGAGVYPPLFVGRVIRDVRAATPTGGA